MEITQRKPDDDDELDVDVEELNLDEDDEKFHYIMVADDCIDKVPLPNMIKLMPKYPGENNVMRKRFDTDQSEKCSLCDMLQACVRA